MYKNMYMYMYIVHTAHYMYVHVHVYTWCNNEGGKDNPTQTCTHTIQTEHVNIHVRHTVCLVLRTGKVG